MLDAGGLGTPIDLERLEFFADNRERKVIPSDHLALSIVLGKRRCDQPLPGNQRDIERKLVSGAGGNRDHVVVPVQPEPAVLAVLLLRFQTEGLRAIRRGVPDLYGKLRRIAHIEDSPATDGQIRNGRDAPPTG